MKLFTKTFLAMSMLTAFTFTSCSEDEQTNLNVSSKKLYFSAEPQSKSSVVNVDGNWSFSVSEESKTWLKAAQRANALYVNVEKNTTRLSKEGTITIKGSNEIQIINVLQRELQASIQVDDVSVNYQTEEVALEVLSNIPFETEILDSSNWIVKKEEIVVDTNDNVTLNKIIFTLTKNNSETDREVFVKFKEKNGVYSKQIKIVQKGFEGERIPNAKITSATDDFHETDNPNAPGWGDGGIDFALDGNFNTKYHSKYDQKIVNPINLDINFGDVSKMDYITYYPRNGGGGAFTKVEIWYTSASQNTLTKLMDFDNFKLGDSPTKIIFPQTIENVQTVRMRVLECKGGQNAACAELEFYYFK